MRFGWLAAAAAVVCAGQASAARYYEFQVSGFNVIGFYAPNGVTFDRYLLESTITATFDTLGAPPTYVASSPGQNSVYLTFNLPSRLNSRSEPNGVYFDRMFNAADITTGSALRQLNTTGTFGYTNCPSSCADNGPGVLTSVFARTSDVAPAALGVFSRQTLTLLPEPASWAMMILGVAAIGYASRRRTVVFQQSVAS